VYDWTQVRESLVNIREDPESNFEDLTDQVEEEQTLQCVWSL
jgi:hypothetical protein